MGGVGGLWGTRRVLSVCVCTAGLAVAYLPASQPTDLVFEKHTRQTLNTLVTALQREFVMCLVGRVGENGAHVSELFVPRVAKSTESMVLYGRCPEGTVGLWHNHLPDPSNIRQRHRCYLSLIDLESAQRQGYLYWVVHVDAEHLCWFTRQQAIDALKEGYALLYYIDGQYDFPKD
jgi:proteasome lid subunit RPN8/RPN11